MKAPRQGHLSKKLAIVTIRRDTTVSELVRAAGQEYLDDVAFWPRQG